MNSGKKIICVVIAAAFAVIGAAGCGLLPGTGQSAEPTTITSVPTESVQQTVEPTPQPTPQPTPEPTVTSETAADTSLTQLQAKDGYMQPKSLEGIDPLNDKVIALTFDDGPNPVKTPELLDILEKNDAVATFFMVGNLVEKNAELVKRAYDEGNEIGTHCYSHPTEAWKNMSTEERLAEYTQANDTIQAATGLRALIDRPVGGGMTEEMAEQIGREQIIWSVDPEDWKYKDADTVYAHVMNGWNEGNVEDGAVILSHDIYQSTVDAYARIIPALKEQGYKFVTVTQMMQIAEIRGKKIEYRFFSAIPDAAA